MEQENLSIKLMVVLALCNWELEQSEIDEINNIQKELGTNLRIPEIINELNRNYVDDVDKACDDLIIKITNKELQKKVYEYCLKVARSDSNVDIDEANFLQKCKKQWSL